MLRIHQCKSAAAAQSYYTQGLAREDYYVAGQEIPGRWGGRAAALLGLTLPARRAEVDRAAFLALTENRRPGSGERLTLRTKADRTVGYDMNFHAPKGVSLLHALHRDGRVVEAFRAAVDETMREIEADAAARVRKAGRQEDRRTGNLAWAEFVHFTARPTEAARGPDPHLHAHCFVFNATYDERERAWKAGQFRSLVRDAPYFEAAFHARFAARLAALGYAVERTDAGWDLAGVPRPLVEKFSTRTLEIEAFATERGITDPEAKGRVGARTRRSKDAASSIDDLRAAWDARLTDDERALMARIAAGGAAPPDPGEAAGAARDAVDRAVAHCFERRSSYPERRLIAEALRFGVGRVSPEGVRREVEGRDWLSREVRGQKLLTTPEVLAEEKRIVRFAVEGKGRHAPFAERIERLQGRPWAVADPELAPDQRSAIEHLLSSQDRVLAVRGAAGAGKTTMMREAVAAIRAAGHSVVVVAPTAEAARGEESLRRKGFPGADTVARLLSDPAMQEGLTNSSGGGVLWVDEAGLLGAGTTARLFELAERRGARVVLSGDERQHKPVERGDALRVLERHGGVAPAELTSIRRQRGMYREAVAALSERRVDDAAALLRDLGAFKEIGSAEERVAAAARDYVSTVDGRRSALVVSPTHAEGRRVAAAIRSLQRASGRLRGEDRVFTRLRDTGFTEAERGDPAVYAPGMVAQFHRPAKGVVAGDRCEVLGVERGADGSARVRARTPRGVEIDLPLDKADRFQVYAREQIRLAVGDRVRVTRNGRTADDRGRLTNGMTGTVKGFTRHGAIRLDTGRGRTRVVPRAYGHLAYGSVMTSHAAQGRDVDRVILVQSAESMMAASAEQFYVSVSRGKREIAIYTDSADSLMEGVRRSAARLSAIELAETGLEAPAGGGGAPRGKTWGKAPGKPRGLTRGQDAARRRAQDRDVDLGRGAVKRGDRSRGGKPRGRGKGGDGQDRERDRER